MSQVSRKGEKPASSPALDAELRFRKNARSGAPNPDYDRPPVSTFPGPKPHVHEGQLDLSGERREPAT